MSRDISDIWLPEMQKVMKEKHNAIILGTHTWPEQDFYCRGDIKSVEDFKGKKIRVQGTSQADLATAFGATGVTIAFGEVVPALEKGVVDCGITGTMPAYKAKWPEVTNTLFRLPVGFTVGMLVANLTMWNKLSPDTQKLIQEQVKDLEDRSWKSTAAETEDGVFCTTGTGACPAGPPGKLKLVKPSDADLKARDKALNEHVLKALGQALRRGLRGQVDRADRQEVRSGGEGQLTGHRRRHRVAGPFSFVMPRTRAEAPRPGSWTEKRHANRPQYDCEKLEMSTSEV